MKKSFITSGLDVFPFHNYSCSYETGQSVGRTKTGVENPEKNI